MSALIDTAAETFGKKPNKATTITPTLPLRTNSSSHHYYTTHYFHSPTSPFSLSLPIFLFNTHHTKSLAPTTSLFFFFFLLLLLLLSHGEHRHLFLLENRSAHLRHSRRPLLLRHGRGLRPLGRPQRVRGAAGGAGTVPSLRRGERAVAHPGLLRRAQAGAREEPQVPLRPRQGPRRPPARPQAQRLPRPLPPHRVQRPRQHLRVPQAPKPTAQLQGCGDLRAGWKCEHCGSSERELNEQFLRKWEQKCAGKQRWEQQFFKRKQSGFCSGAGCGMHHRSSFPGGFLFIVSS